MNEKLFTKASVDNLEESIGLYDSDLFRYCRVTLGYGSKPGVKMVKLVCDALAKRGFPKPKDVNAAWWVGQHGAHIRTISRQHSRKQYQIDALQRKLDAAKQSA